MAIEFTDENFEELVIKSDKPALVDFWAEWCGPCRMLTPIVNELYEEYKDKAVIGKCNVDENNDVTLNYFIKNIPTILLFKNGQVVDKIIGVVPKSQLVSKLNALL